MTTTDAAAATLASRIREAIRDVPDFPKPGVVFKDITPVLADPVMFAAVCEAMAAPFRGTGVTRVAAIESRGFILGGPIAERLGAGFVPIRKPGKLPAATDRVEYALEYGTDALEIHLDACDGDHRVLIVDDVLATGGTAAAAARLVEQRGSEVVGLSFLVALRFLGGEALLGGRRSNALVAF